MKRLPPVKPLTATEQYEQTYERANQIDYPLPPMLLTQLKSFGLNEIRRKNRHLTGSDNPLYLILWQSIIQNTCSTAFSSTTARCWIGGGTRAHVKWWPNKGLERRRCLPSDSSARLTHTRFGVSQLTN